MSLTCTAVHSPPRAVLIPRAVSARATPRSDCTPLFCNRKAIGGLAIGQESPLARAVEVGVAETLPTRLSGLQRVLSALGNRFPLVLGHGCEDMHGQLVGMWVIDGHEFNAAVHQRRDEREIAAQPVELGETSLALCFLQAERAAASCGRSAYLPLSTSVNSATIVQLPPLR
jgi:hypothetical protein